MPLVQGPGEEGDVADEEAVESDLVQREWWSHMRRWVKEGYRDGIDAGKAVTLQQGFNQGFKEGAEVIINYGQLRGTLSALLSWCHLHDNSSSLISKINNLLDAVGQCEEYVLRHLKSITPQPHVVDLLDSIQDMDLCHIAPAEEKIDEAKDERFYENNAEFNKNCSKNLSGVDCSSLASSIFSSAGAIWQRSISWMESNFKVIAPGSDSLFVELTQKHSFKRNSHLLAATVLGRSWMQVGSTHPQQTRWNPGTDVWATCLISSTCCHHYAGSQKVASPSLNLGSAVGIIMLVVGPTETQRQENVGTSWTHHSGETFQSMPSC